MKSARLQDRGFTLVEMLIAMVLTFSRIWTMRTVERPA